MWGVSDAATPHFDRRSVGRQFFEDKALQEFCPQPPEDGKTSEQVELFYERSQLWYGGPRFDSALFTDRVWLHYLKEHDMVDCCDAVFRRGCASGALSDLASRAGYIASEKVVNFLTLASISMEDGTTEFALLLLGPVSVLPANVDDLEISQHWCPLKSFLVPENSDDVIDVDGPDYGFPVVASMESAPRAATIRQKSSWPVSREALVYCQDHTGRPLGSVAIECPGDIEEFAGYIGSARDLCESTQSFRPLPHALHAKHGAFNGQLDARIAILPRLLPIPHPCPFPVGLWGSSMISLAQLHAWCERSSVVNQEYAWFTHPVVRAWFHAVQVCPDALACNWTSASPLLDRALISQDDRVVGTWNCLRRGIAHRLWRDHIYGVFPQSGTVLYERYEKNCRLSDDPSQEQAFIHCYGHVSATGCFDLWDIRPVSNKALECLFGASWWRALEPPFPLPLPVVPVRINLKKSVKQQLLRDFPDDDTLQHLIVASLPGAEPVAVRTVRDDDDDDSFGDIDVITSVSVDATAGGPRPASVLQGAAVTSEAANVHWSSQAPEVKVIDPVDPSAEASATQLPAFGNQAQSGLAKPAAQKSIVGSSILRKSKPESSTGARRRQKKTPRRTASSRSSEDSDSDDDDSVEDSDNVALGKSAISSEGTDAYSPDEDDDDIQPSGGQLKRSVDDSAPASSSQPVTSKRRVASDMSDNEDASAATLRDVLRRLEAAEKKIEQTQKRATTAENKLAGYRTLLQRERNLSHVQYQRSLGDPGAEACDHLNHADPQRDRERLPPQLQQQQQQPSSHTQPPPPQPSPETQMAPPPLVRLRMVMIRVPRLPTGATLLSNVDRNLVGMLMVKLRVRLLLVTLVFPVRVASVMTRGLPRPLKPLVALVLDGARITLIERQVRIRGGRLRGTIHNFLHVGGMITVALAAVSRMVPLATMFEERLVVVVVSMTPRGRSIADMVVVVARLIIIVGILIAVPVAVTVVTIVMVRTMIVMLRMAL